MAHLLLQPHNLESLKVCQVLPPLKLFSLLSPRGLGPLLVDLVLLPQLLDGTRTGGFGQVGNDPGCERDGAGVNGLTRDDCAFFR